MSHLTGMHLMTGLHLMAMYLALGVGYWQQQQILIFEQEKHGDWEVLKPKQLLGMGVYLQWECW